MALLYLLLCSLILGVRATTSTGLGGVSVDVASSTMQVSSDGELVTLALRFRVVYDYELNGPLDVVVKSTEYDALSFVDAGQYGPLVRGDTNITATLLLRPYVHIIYMDMYKDGIYAFGSHVALVATDTGNMRIIGPVEFVTTYYVDGMPPWSRVPSLCTRTLVANEL